jgi:hypothetical protein
VKLIDFLISLLQTHAQTLKRLAALLGEEDFLDLLETAGENEPTSEFQFHLNSNWFEAPTSKTHRQAYGELEGAVRDLNLPAVLEFHLWAYPFYRSFIESSINLRSRIKTQDSAGETLVLTAVENARFWVRQLPIPPEFSRQVEQAALTPWVRFRSETLRKLGKRPFEVI